MHTARIKLIVAVVALAMVVVPPAVAEAPRDPGCDFNADGFGDLAIGAFQERTGRVETGAINVLYGSADGVTTAGDDYWTPRSKGMPSGTGQFYDFACGDFDGDGFDDLAISELTDAAVTALRGTARGLTTAGARRMSSMGTRLAAGDFNGDGVDDLVAGSPGALDGEGTIDAFYGVSGTGLTKRGRQRVNQPESFGATPDGCGGAVVTGDFNGDRFSDVVWSCERAWNDEVQDTYGTSVRQVLGSAAGLERAQSRPLPVNHRYDLAVGDFDGDGSDDLAYAGETRHGTPASGLLDGSVRTFTVTGMRVAAGDFDGDGIDDLAVGDHEVSSSGFSRVRGGSVIVLDGTAEGLDPASAQAWNPARRGVSGTPQRGDQFGWAVSATDANGDGRDDLLVGIRLKDIVVDGTIVPNAGAAHLFYGSASGVTAVGDRLLSQNTRGVRGAAERSDLFGATLARTGR